MLLAKYNIQEGVTEHINSYLAEAELSFSDYKTLILSKFPIPAVHSALVSSLQKAKTADQVEVRKALENQACKNQTAEDEKETIDDNSANLTDMALKEKSKQELMDIPNLEQGYITQLNVLRRKLTRIIAAKPDVIVTQYPQSAQKHAQQSAKLNRHTHAITNIKQSIFDYEAKIETLINKRNTLQQKIHQIEHRIEKRLAKQEHRKKREHARVGYLITGEGIQEILSVNNRHLLAKNIHEQDNALEKKCAELIHDSDQLHYPCLLEQLPNHLSKQKPLSQFELEALKSILKYMREHLLYEQQINNIEESLTKIKHSISIQIAKITKLREK